MTTSIEYRKNVYPHRTDYLSTMVHPENGATYTLITHDGFVNVLVVTSFNHLLGFDSLEELTSRVLESDIALLGVNKSNL